MVSFKKTVSVKDLNDIAEEYIEKSIRICQDVINKAFEKLKINGMLCHAYHSTSRSFICHCLCWWIFQVEVSKKQTTIHISQGKHLHVSLLK
jgi:hypothetical protein